MKKPKDTHKIEIKLTFDTRRGFLVFKGAVSKARGEARGSFGSFLPLQKTMEQIEKQAKKQNWEDLWKDPTP